MTTPTKPKVPDYILKAINSSQVYTALEKIGEKHNLFIDKVGQLNTDTESVLTGEIKSEDFINTISKNLEISQDLAEKIAVDINSDIFEPLKESLRKSQEEKEVTAMTPPPAPPLAPNMSSLEKTGGFIVEKRPESTSPLYKSSTLNREEVLHDLENIEKLKPQNSTNFVEHLLTTPVATPHQVEVKKPDEKAAKAADPELPTTKYSTDPYREQF